MKAQPQQLRFYQTACGKRPFAEWFDSRRAQHRIDARMTRLELGNFGDACGVGEGVIELRVDYGPGYRVYFGRDGDQVVLLLLGGDKRTQSRDIDEARSFWADYKQRSKGPAG